MVVVNKSYTWTNPLIITTELAKHNLRVDHALDDDEIQIMIYSAYQDVESYLNRVLVEQSITFLVNTNNDEFSFELSQPEAFEEVASVTAIATDGTKHIALTKTVAFDGRKVTVSGLTFDSAFEVSSYQMTIAYTPGLLNDVINQAVYMTITNYYENRNSVVVGTIANKLPMGVEHIIQKFKYQLI